MWIYRDICVYIGIYRDICVYIGFRYMCIIRSLTTG